MMSLGRQQQTVGILCVDDNPRVAEALRMQFARLGDFEWRGWLSSADDLVERGCGEAPVMVLLDIDMPGRDPFEALAELMERCAEAKVVVLSGHVRRELIERAIDAGAWGYVSKNDGETALIDALREVSRGAFAMSREVAEIWGA